MSNILSIRIEGLDKALGKVKSLASKDNRLRMNREIGFNVQERTADHIARASVSRHKTADRLGAPHSGFLEFAPGRVRSESSFRNYDGSHPYTASKDETVDSVTVVIGNTPGISRALHALVITPKSKRALTIPINAISYGKNVKQMKDEGWKIHRRGKALFGKRSNDEKPLFALLNKVTIPQDRALLPSTKELKEWAIDTMEAFVELELAK